MAMYLLWRCICYGDVFVMAMYLLWRCICYGDVFVMAMYLLWRCICYGDVFVMAMYLLWRCICYGDVFVMAMYLLWRCICYGDVFVMAMYLLWRCICYGDVFVMAMYLLWRCICYGGVFDHQLLKYSLDSYLVFTIRTDMQILGGFLWSFQRLCLLQNLVQETKELLESTYMYIYYLLYGCWHDIDSAESANCSLTDIITPFQLKLLNWFHQWLHIRNLVAPNELLHR